jgi:hypothetical protein
MRNWVDQRSLGIEAESGTDAQRRRMPSLDVQRQVKGIPNGWRPWTEDADKELLLMREGGASVWELARHFERTEGAIRSRIRKLTSDDCGQCGRPMYSCTCDFGV